jgi:glutamate N-acetyltransferase/amino-acid N-acetyltransferase
MKNKNMTEQFINDGGFKGYTFIEGGVCAAKGFKAAGVNAHIKANSQKNDMALIYCDKICNAAALYTQNKVKGAPIVVTKRHLADGRAQAVIVNSGNANTCNSNGIEIAEGACELTAKALDISSEDVIVASTGVIGQKLSLEPFEKNIPILKEMLSENGYNDACTAIMTTDTRQKQFAVEFKLGDKICRLGGMSKGSGMINPNMATMLAFITTDVKISSEMLHSALKQINAITYNMVSVDGDTSTNDMVTLLSSGYADNSEITEFNEDYNIFIYALHAVMMNLARETARDGEGASKLITCVVKNADTEETAKATALSVVNSPLLKTAVSAADANWGRVMCAIGYADADFDVSRVSVDFASRAGEVRVCENGVGVDFSEDEAYKILSEEEVIIIIDLHSGDNPAVAWGCDLTYDYVKINAEYRS